MKGAHTADIIAERLQSIYEEFGLDVYMVTRTVTDNASNFSKAFKDHGLNLMMVEEELSENLNEEEVDFMPILNEEESITLPNLPRQERCKSHSLSLVATTDINKRRRSSMNLQQYTGLKTLHL